MGNPSEPIETKPADPQAVAEAKAAEIPVPAEQQKTETAPTAAT